MKTATYSKIYERPTLKEAQEFIAGYIELMTVRDGKMQILCNEDGVIDGLEVNDEASSIAGFPIVGNAIILTESAMWD